MKDGRISNEEAVARLLMILSRHVGEEKAMDMGELYERVFGIPCSHKINQTRRLRKLITDLRKKGTPIGSTPAQNGGGYYIVRAGSELDAYCSRIRRRALNILDIEAKLRKLAMPELLGQMLMNLKASGGK